jgi:hypothetical protein
MRKTALLVVAAAAAGLSSGGPVRAMDDTSDAIDRLRVAADAQVRLAMIKRLAASKTAAAADALCRTAKTDAEAEVRVAAATALAVMPGDATDALKELILSGGIREVRKQAAIGLCARPHGLEWTLDRVKSPSTSKMVRQLLVSDLGDVASLDVAMELVRLVDDDDPVLRGAALRALARHPFGRAELARAATDALTKRADAETQIAALEAGEEAFDESFRALLPTLKESTEPRVAAGAARVRKRLDYRDALARKRKLDEDNAKRKREGYAPLPDPYGELPPTPPPPRPRVDWVFVQDCTASMRIFSHTGRVRAEWLARAARLENDPTTSVRCGFVLMQDTRREASDPETAYFGPRFLTAPLAELRWRNQSIGVDTRGIEVGTVLREALDRFEWRLGAERRIVVVSDCYVGDPELSRRTASVHRAADGLTLDVEYAGLQDHHRATWEALARAGGGGVTVVENKPR